MTLGFRIKRNWERVSADLAAQFKPLPVANVSDSMGRMDAGGPALRPYHRSGVMAGPAYTLRTRPGDNLLLHKAIDAAQPGDVIVCDSGGDATNSMIGEMMVTHAKVRGVAGFVINGSVRDRDELLDINLPIYAVGATHRGPYKDGPGEIGFPVCLSGMVVNPGDLILGDGDGVLCVPREHAASVLEAAKAKQAAETEQLRQIKEGTVDRSWVDKALEAKGCEYVD